MSLSEREIEGGVTTLGLVLDQLQAGTDIEFHRATIRGIGVVLAAQGGQALMGTVLDKVLDQDPEKESWREGAVDPRWSGIGGWMS